MTRLSKVKPLVQVTAKQKKKQEKISVRYSRSRAFLTGLMQGNYQLPPITNEPDQPSDQIAHHEQTHYFGEDNNPGDSQTAGPLSIDDLSAWGSIPWNEAATSNIPKPTLSSYLDPEVSATIREHDRNVAHHRRENNWRQMMSKLFVSYLWLKEKTQNWTSPCSFDSFVSKLCKCSKDAPCSDHWIDLVDINGQQRLQVSFCKCLPRAVQILAIGFVPSTPIQPTAGFSMRLLAYHNYAWHNSNVRMGPFHETQRQFNEERSQVLWNQRQTEGRDLTTCLSACVTVYRELLERTSNLVQTVLQLSPAQKLASNTCPACFGPSLKTGSHQLLWVDNKLIIALDGNFQHRHHKAAGRNATPLSTPTMFIPPSDLDAMKDHIASQEKIHKVPKKGDKCANTHKAGNDTRNESTWKGCDDTGLMGSCCRHDSVIFLVNIHGTGENRALPLAILKRLLDDIDDPTRPVGVMYDLGCSLDKFINRRHIFAEHRSRLSFATSVFHAYVHEWPCQLQYNPRYQIGWGLSDGEALERLWSSLSPQVGPLRYTTRNNRLGALAHRCKYRNKQSILNLAAWLCSKFEQALVRRDREKDVLTELIHMKNPHGNGHTNYTVSFFRAQWADQVRMGLTQEDLDDAAEKSLAQFFENEEVIGAYKYRIANGTWPATLADLNDLLQVVEKKEEAQRTLAISLGRNYEELRRAQESEFAMLKLLWKAKSELYAQAVETRAERQPVVTAKSQNTAGTRLKEKIMAAIKRRKNPVEKAIKNFNQRRRAYLQKFDPARLLLPENKDLVYADFVNMDLDDPLWRDGHFYHARAPWALDPNVRSGIKSVLVLDRVEEEVELLTQELDRSITWAYDYRNLLLRTLAQVATESEEPVSADNIFSNILPSVPTEIKLGLLHLELNKNLTDHNRLMVSWMLNIESLWRRTRSRHTKASHPWFDVIHSIKEKLTQGNIGDIDEALENLTFREEGLDQIIEEGGSDFDSAEGGSDDGEDVDMGAEAQEG
ncbi:hypothetical protein Pst134EA_024562 [Puccinia striiformis f. sp. tritici]|uniref:hypothetical protein n=1 Tax=Puccinia striiformis f. sp. tritici TaxID=168172 RepID=UPI0020074BAB|nr:hypothetical protein Pst134EA_024562 [Puccinia striiformis f. sp. tritici]KAH9453693.1 hypothetical protein Pst134EA_024562 [Puccinia striiformis f. sp. tritici]